MKILEYWSVCYDDIDVIENDTAAMKKYGWHLGGAVALDREQVQALLDGKALAFDDGEYVRFIVMKEDD